MARYRFHAPATDSAHRTHDAAPTNIGNRLYTLSLPPGEYEAEDDDEAGLMRIHRVDASHPRQFVAAVPAGRYSIETEDDGTAHLYKEPDDEPVRVPLMEGTLDVAHRATAERAALRQLNAGNTSFWKRERSNGNAVVSDVNQRNADFWAGRR